MKKHKKITPEERDLIATYLASGINKTEIARRLNRPRETIIKEIVRNSSLVFDNSVGKKVKKYIAISAQAKRDKKILNSAYNKQELKNPKVYAYVTEELRGGWSPEQIAGRIKLEYGDDPHYQICAETIYVWIYDKNKQKLKSEEELYWYEYLRRKQKKRKKKSGRSVHKSHIPDRVSISQRSKVANERKEFGHWEADSIEGRRKVKGDSLHTEVERISRRIKAEKVKDLSSKEGVKAQMKIFSTEPRIAIKSTTHDNGKENYLHCQLRDKLGMKTYHAHPYSSYERGTNENGNWHIRYYFPKGTDFSNISNQELQAVIEEINNRPRKILGYKTANEVYYQLLQSEFNKV